MMIDEGEAVDTADKAAPIKDEPKHDKDEDRRGQVEVRSKTKSIE
jgi:hypothetical protein